MIIDSHQHFWHYQPTKHTWITNEMAVLQKDYLPADLAPILQQNGVDGCIAVQAEQSIAETNFLLDLAEQHRIIRGVVGWVDLQAPDLVATLTNWQTSAKLLGFRHIVQDEPDDNFLLRPAFQRGLSLLGQYDFTYDVLIYPRQLPAALQTIQRFPNQRFVIDHLAKPNIKAGHIQEWEENMRAIAQHENVYCKISGMITEADWRNWSYAALVPYLDVVFDAFGTQRLMFGSDWPVCLLAGSYRKVKQVLARYLAHFSQTEKDQIWGENARVFYRFPAMA